MSVPNKEICSECGKIHVTWTGYPACSAHKVNTDPLEPCTKHPKNGMSVCRTHGGALPVNVAAAQERLAFMGARGEIGQLMRECDIPDQHPVEGLLEVVRISGSMMRLLTVKVGELQEDPEVSDVLVEKDDDMITIQRAARDGFWGLNKDREMVIHPFVKLLREWTERYERACKTALDAGIAERQVRLAESQGELLATAVRGILGALNLTAEQWALAPKVVEAQLRQLESA